ncbi:MAG: FlgD immunoglobulin-like domain containing protein [Salinispira sp.]
MYNRIYVRKFCRMQNFVMVFFMAAAVLGAQNAEQAEFNSTFTDNAAGLVGGSNARFPEKLPSALLFNPAVFNPLNVPLLELGYGGIIDTTRTENAYSGHRASSWINIPLERGQLNGGIEFQYLDTSVVATGGVIRLHFGWANNVVENLVLGAAVEGGIGFKDDYADWALSAKVGVSQNLGAVGPFSEFAWHAALTGIGKEILTPGETYYRSPFTPRGGVTAALRFSENAELYNAVNVAFPEFTDVLLGLQTSLRLFNAFSVSLAWNIDFRQQLEDGYQNASLLPRLSFSYSLLEHEHPDIDTTISIYSPYPDHFAFAAGAAFPLQKVDRDPPAIEIALPKTIYISPNDDGIQDSWSEALQIDDPSGIAKVELRVPDRDSFTQTWERTTNVFGMFRPIPTITPPQTLSLSGRNTDGRSLSDGKYDVSLSAIDTQGNASPARQFILVIDTEYPQVNISAPRTTFSPAKEPLRIEQSGSTEELWNIEISDSAGALVKTERISNSPPTVYYWDGTDNAGQRLPDGTYEYHISSNDLAGNYSSETISHIIIDSLSPDITLSASSTCEREGIPTFSPNNDGSCDTLHIQQTVNTDPPWTGTGKIRRADNGQLVKTFSFNNSSAQETILWDGRNDAGRIAPNTSYIYELSATDDPGNTTTDHTGSFILDTTRASVSVRAAAPAFSPNGDSIMETQELSMQVSPNNFVRSYDFEIRNIRGQSVYRVSENGAVPEKLTWNGRNTEGKLAADGEFSALLRVRLDNGSITEGESAAFLLDTQYPVIQSMAEYLLFSPNGDEKKDTLPIVQQGSGEALYSAVIYNEDGDDVWERTWTGELNSIQWDGRSRNNAILPDGAYRYVVSSEDIAGNKTEKRISTIELDNRETTVAIALSEEGISPNNDRYKDSLSITLSVNVIDAIESWTVGIYDDAGALVWERSAASLQNMDTTIPFSGVMDNSGRMREGAFYAQAAVIYAKGDTPVSQRAAFTVDVTAPELSANIQPLPFSPVYPLFIAQNDDGTVVDPAAVACLASTRRGSEIDEGTELNIGLESSDPSGLLRWDLKIYDREENLFYEIGSDVRSASGGGEEARESIQWNGLANTGTSTGESVISNEVYQYRFSASDNLKNYAELSGDIPIGILVFCTEDKRVCETQIANINFAPNSSNIILNNSPTGRKNRATFTDLAHTLKLIDPSANNYSDYSIRIEGHANQIIDPPGPRLFPLSSERAQAVRNELIKSGINRNRMTAEGCGNAQPIVPGLGESRNFTPAPSTFAWKNRRVEFILVKE